MTRKTFPLTNRNLRDNFAYLTQDNKTTGDTKGFVSAQRFIDTVVALSKQLPSDKQHIINLCGNRYLFTVVLCASVLKNQVNLLPSNRNIATQKRLSERYNNTYVIHDGSETDPDLLAIDLDKEGISDIQTVNEIPEIDVDQLAAISFTSGSTGDAKPNEKIWRTFVDSTIINSHYMLPKSTETIQLLATVPAQHMWGLETSVLMALFANICVVDSKPLFPQDIQTLIETLPAPRMMVSTPVHLRAVVGSNLKFPKLETVLCATSPLTQELATQVEALFSTQMREVYGCSEIGSMAIRETAHTDIWDKFDGIHFDQQTSNQILAHTEHVKESATLGDFIELLNEQQFRLKGRTDDMIDIAGKRGSLNEINKVLLSFPELIDGIVFFPPQDRPIPRLVAIVAIKDGISKKQLADHFREYLDPAFIPRPIIQVEKLPREENGKLPKQALLRFYQELIKN
ncbi:xanthomonadin biosynthesis 3-hydroxybenozate--AMP ligase XanA2 [Cocleimonas flava]|uniref:AMP-binding enzyme n=1 Tax=Cocleimonas flava TaxID=634765 RepID=A0A4R1EUV6_9GAMM|nr:AMP-binding protein [Cocleimonas flava]TCJ82888.1 AMP-binding enzyme [Cocleimonas flava]